MRVLVSGGTGFIGAHVCKQLVERGHEVACFDIAELTPVVRTVEDSVEFIHGDISDPVSVADALARFDPNRVVHLAALLGRSCQADPRRAFEVNVDGTLTLLDLAESHGVERVVTASSVGAYGDITDLDRLDESVTQEPTSVYGLTKYSVERLGGTYREQRDIEFAAMEPAHGMGPDRMRGNVEDSFIVKAAVADEELTVPAVDHPIEIIYVTDTARAFVEATLADSLPHDRYLVGTGERATLAEIVEMVRDHVPNASLTMGEHSDENELAAHPPIDASRIHEDFGWAPEHSIDEGVAAYVAWLRENPEKWSFDAADAPWQDV